MFEKYYTPEQLQQLEQRRNELGEDADQGGRAGVAPDSTPSCTTCARPGVDPAAPEAQAVGDRAGELIRCSRAATRGSPTRCGACTSRRTRESSRAAWATRGHRVHGRDPDGRAY